MTAHVPIVKISCTLFLLWACDALDPENSCGTSGRDSCDWEEITTTTCRDTITLDSVATQVSVGMLILKKPNASPNAFQFGCRDSTKRSVLVIESTEESPSTAGCVGRVGDIKDTIFTLSWSPDTGTPNATVTHDGITKSIAITAPDGIENPHTLENGDQAYLYITDYMQLDFQNFEVDLWYSSRDWQGFQSESRNEAFQNIQTQCEANRPTSYFPWYLFWSDADFHPGNVTPSSAYNPPEDGGDYGCYLGLSIADLNIVNTQSGVVAQFSAMSNGSADFPLNNCSEDFVSNVPKNAKDKFPIEELQEKPE